MIIPCSGKGRSGGNPSYANFHLVPYLKDYFLRTVAGAWKQQQGQPASFSGLLFVLSDLGR